MKLRIFAIRNLRGTLHIGIAPTLAHLWLMPRLPRFQAQWPGLNLQFRVRARGDGFLTRSGWIWQFTTAPRATPIFINSG
ncbi:LysR family transcriptional regulator [Klebsiella pneumoniae]|uniref:LysR family transcriptional regulator n=1 Tax=Klebsiella pneumoniae TaxID=573 RepID=A0A3S4GUQ4_KLEPN|nr:LysR family transcriptional regulator [Klebsiella pneumoniae]